jgi:hypothetical protein
MRSTLSLRTSPRLRLRRAIGRPDIEAHVFSRLSGHMSASYSPPMKVLGLGALIGLVLGGGLVIAISATGLVKVPTPETCFLGFPNSGNGTIFEVTGKGAWDVCDDLTNPIRLINA